MSEYTYSTAVLRTDIKTLLGPHKLEWFDRWLAAADAEIRADERAKIAAAIREQEQQAAAALDASGGDTLLSGYANGFSEAARIAEAGRDT